MTFTIAIITARKRSLGQGNIFRSICLSTWGWWWEGCYDVTSCYGQHPPLDSTPLDSTPSPHFWTAPSHCWTAPSHCWTAPSLGSCL